MTAPSPPTWLDAYFGSGIVAVRSGNTTFPAETAINFEGPGVSVGDDPANGQTVITITGGTGSTTTTTANFTQPAVSANVTVPVVSTASLAAGLIVFIAGGGYYLVVSVTDATHFVAENLGLSGNAAPTTVINSGALVIPAGPNAGGLVIEGNDVALTVRNTLDFRGFTVADDSVNGRTVVTNTHGTPLSGSSFTLTTAQPWGLIQAGGVYTFPASPVVGQDLDLTAVSGDLNANPAEFVGNGHNIAAPDNRYTNASTAFGKVSGANYRFRFDGSIYQCLGVS